MVRALTFLFLCQLAGEVVVRAADLDFPGPVLGMGLLVGSLAVSRRIRPGLDEVADGILKNLSLLFVPAAVGVMQQVGAIAANWVAIAAALLVSTLLTLVVTVLTFRGVVRLQAGGRT